ncbi:MAG: J domain-containing protein [Campylobacterota bacterium]|nr:J domain-containing protein [Campylobacterota bacterium]
MEVVLQNNLILIRTGFDTLKSSWMADFLNLHAQDMLFLPKSVLVFNNGAFEEKKRSFLKTLSEKYAKTQDFSAEFYWRSMMRYANKPIKIELVSHEEPQPVSVELFAHDDTTVVISLYSPNLWVFSYLRSQLDLYITEVTPTSLVLDVSQMMAKTRLERSLNKRHILHYQLQYRYDSEFMQRLYGSYTQFNFDDEYEEEEHFESMLHYYTVLECPIGSSQDALKKSYKKLVKVYHPDRVHRENSEVVNHYTQKFQLLQEAYTALRIVS